MPVREASVPSAPPGLGPRREEALDAIRQLWGYDTLRPLQEEAIAATLARRDSLVVMPTGGGKSLCYQLPPLLSGRLCIVVSPLIALMKDQVDGLRAAGYPAAALHSNLDAEETAAIRAQVAAGGVRLLLVAPERLLTESFLAWLARLHDKGGGAEGTGGIESIAIDEAHCISQWGHDFRPEYRRLAELRAIFPGVPFHAYTATATPRVRDDIVAQLRLREPVVLVGIFDRPNLTYRILPRVDLLEQVVEALNRHPNRAAIVYCISRKDTESLAASLRNRHIDARAYHAGMDGSERTRVQSDFKNEKLNVVVATVAFGMGIDRGDVRCVIHAAMPKTVEHYQQETGRAGRDGLPAECVLFYSGGDVVRWKQVMQRGAQDSDAPDDSVRAALAVQFELLEHIQRLCSGTRCRHRALTAYFGQEYTPPAGDQVPAPTPAKGLPGGCGACDVCLDELDHVEDATDIARKILSCVFRVEQNFGAAYVADVLRGSRLAKILERRHDQLSTFGLLKDTPRETILGYINQLVDAGLLDRSGGEYPVLRLNGASAAVLKNQHAVTLSRPKQLTSAHAEVAAAAAPLSPQEQQFFESLRGLRRMLAEKANLPPYAVFGDETLQEIVRVRPGSPASLVSIRGIGQVKLATFGPAVLAHVREWCAANSLPLDAAKGSRPRRADLGDGRTPRQGRPRTRSTEMFGQGATIDEVAQAIGLSHNTAAAHLCDYILSAKPASVEKWVDPLTHREVKAAASEVGTDLLRPIFDKLGGKVPYEQIRVVVNHIIATGSPTG